MRDAGITREELEGLLEKFIFPRYGEGCPTRVESIAIDLDGLYENLDHYADLLGTSGYAYPFLVDLLYVGDELMTINGAQYAHPCLRNNPEYDYMSGMSWMYRRDWAKALGLYQEGDIYTWDEWVALNKAFVEQDPGGNGAGKTIGMGTELFYFPNAFGIYQPSAEYGYGAFSPKDGEYVWTAARPETLEGLMIAKDLYDQGIIWPDNPLGQTPDDTYKAGLMGSVFNNFDVGRVHSMRKALKENFPDIDENEAGALAFVIGPDGTMWCKQSQCYWGAVVMSANIGEAKMTRWLDMLDWMLSEEGTYFRAYGIEGTDWEYDENGEELLNYWFSGFYPADDPRYTITVLQDGILKPETSSAAIFAKVTEILAVWENS
mgnify:CR=1 FL=1